MPFAEWMETLLLRMKGACLYRIIYVLYMLLDFMSGEAMSVRSVMLGNVMGKTYCFVICVLVLHDNSRFVLNF